MNHQFYRRTERSYKTPEVETICNRHSYIIVNNKHKPIFHKDGYILVFFTKSSAEDWMDKQAKKGSLKKEWRIEKMSILITKK